MRFIRATAFFPKARNSPKRCCKAGRVWIGPPPAAIRAMGDKANAKAIAAKAGVPVLPTYDKNPEFPVMIKALAGGGGRGMRLVRSKDELEAALKSAQSEAEHAFGDGRVLLEKALLNPRHVEVQIFADSARQLHPPRRARLLGAAPPPEAGRGIALARGEREAARRRWAPAAIAAARAVGYVGAGTVEFLLEDGKFWFMEMNTRLQVEHPVTEAITGLDLVEWQLRVAAGEPLPARQEDIRFSGHAIEVRLCAEDPEQQFPAAGRHARALAAVRRGARGSRARIRDRDIALLRFDDRQADRARADARRSAREAGRRAGRDGRARHPDQQGISRRCPEERDVRRGQGDHGFLEDIEFRGEKPDFMLAAACSRPTTANGPAGATTRRTVARAIRRGDSCLHREEGKTHSRRRRRYRALRWLLPAQFALRPAAEERRRRERRQAGRADERARGRGERQGRRNGGARARRWWCWKR